MTIYEIIPWLKKFETKTRSSCRERKTTNIDTNTAPPPPPHHVPSSETISYIFLKITNLWSFIKKSVKDIPNGSVMETFSRQEYWHARPRPKLIQHFFLSNHLYWLILNATATSYISIQELERMKSDITIITATHFHLKKRRKWNTRNISAWIMCDSKKNFFRFILAVHTKKIRILLSGLLYCGARQIIY